MEFTVTVLMFYLFDRKLVDLMLFSSYKAKYAQPKNRAGLRDFAHSSAPDRHRTCNMTKSDMSLPEQISLSNFHEILFQQIKNYT